MSQGGKVHSVSGLASDGVYHCRCDKPAVTLVSKTDRNPGREFYKCADEACGLFKWKDELSPPNRPSQSLINSNSSPFNTPSTHRTQGLATPQTTPAKRTFEMASGSSPRSTQKRNLSPGAKERRMKAILQAQLEAKVEEEMKQSQQTQVQVQGSVLAQDAHSPKERTIHTLEKHASIQTDDVPDSEDDGDEEENNRIAGTNDTNRAAFAGDGDANGVAEGSEPATKRGKFKVEAEEEEAALALSRSNSRGRRNRPDSRTSPSRGAGMLLTPPQSSVMEVEEELFRPERPESPTNFTKKGGQVARSFYKGKGKEREQDASESSASGSSFNERFAAAFPAEPGPSSDDSQKTMPDSSPTQTRCSTYDIAMKALDNMANQQSHLRSVLMTMEEEKTRLQSRGNMSESREKDLEKQIEELKSINKVLQEENSSLLERLELIQQAFSPNPRLAPRK